MKWLIGIIVIIGIGLGIWFLVLKLQSEEAGSEFVYYPETTWLIFETNNLSEFYSQVSDPTSIFHSVPMLRPLFEAMSVFSKPLSSSKEDGKLVISGSLEAPFFTLISNDKSAKDADWSSNQTVINTQGPFVVSNSIETEVVSEATLKGIEKSGQALGGKTRFYVRLSSLTRIFSESLSERLIPLIVGELMGFNWLGFDLKNTPDVTTASGIATQTSDESHEKNAANLLRFVPSEANLALVIGQLDRSFAIISCPYEQVIDSADNNIFILANPEDSNSLSSISDQFKTGWSNLSFAQKSLGDVIVFGATEDAVERFSNDYLNDHRLITSAAFRPLASHVSDASFTLFVKNDQSVRDLTLLSSLSDSNTLNSFVFQMFSELPGSKYFSFSALHHQSLIDAMPVLWTNLLDDEVAAGPWEFKNHYTNEPEIIVQDKLNQLYLINAEGKTLWKKQLNALVVGEVVQVDAFDSKKLQMLMATSENLHLIDRNGNNAEGFPVKLTSGASVQPTAIKYSEKTELRLFICDGTILKNFDASGKEVNGWKAPTLDAPLALPIRWWSFDGKDYLVTCSKAGTIKSFDRGGAARGKAFNFPRGSFNYNLLDGSNYENIEVAAADSLGNLIRCNLNGNCKSDHILTITDYSMLLTNANGDVRYVSIWDEHVVGINKDLDVRLDFQTSEKITSARWIRKEKGWLALAVESSGQLYISDSEGRMLKKMPVAGDRHNLVLDLDGNGVKELVTHSGKGELVAYSLSY